jgi:hypothetical protein
MRKDHTQRVRSICSNNNNNAETICCHELLRDEKLLNLQNVSSIVIFSSKAGFHWCYLLDDISILVVTKRACRTFLFAAGEVFTDYTNI